MKRIIVLLIFVFVLFGCVCVETPVVSTLTPEPTITVTPTEEVEEVYMAIEFDETAHQGVDFGAISGIPSLQNLYILSVVAIARLDASTTINYLGGIYDHDNSGADETAVFFLENDGRLSFSGPGRVTVTGYWRSDAADIVFDGSAYTLGVSIDGSDTANDPVLYINGSSVGVNEINSPAGALETTLTGRMYFGAPGGAVSRKPIDGVEYLLAVFDRVLTADEHKLIHDQRGVDGLDPVFLVYALGAATQQIYDGQTLLAADEIVEELNGHLGVPANSPLGYADDYLHIR